MIYRYARVSTDGQTLGAQIVALKAAGAEKVFSEKQSGAKTDRAVLSRALAALASGDVLLVKGWTGSPEALDIRFHESCHFGGFIPVGWIPI